VNRIALLALLAIAGCARAADRGQDAGAGLPVDSPLAALDAHGDEHDAPHATADAASHDAPDAPPSFTPTPPSDLPTLQLQGSCTEIYKGWTLDQSGNCVADNSTSTFMQTRPVTIAADGSGGYDLTSYAFWDSLGERWDTPYTVDISSVQPTATYQFNPTCVLPGACVTHVYALSAQTLALATHYLDDDYSATPVPQCWMYSYDQQDCTFQLTW
jgi:hypothetical protein